MRLLTDDSLFPFGKHKGELMADVPVDYLHWLWHNGLKDNRNSDVGDYIRRNLEALQMENRDLVW